MKLNDLDRQIERERHAPHQRRMLNETTRHVVVESHKHHAAALMLASIALIALIIALALFILGS